MQKRLLALVATVAMVLSMFAGIVFAEDPTLAEQYTALVGRLGELDEEAVYTAASWTTLQTAVGDLAALLKVETLPAGLPALPEGVDEAAVGSKITAVDSAITALALSAWGEYKAVIAEVDALDPADYKTAGYEAFQEAVKGLLGFTASHSTVILGDATSSIRTALDELYECKYEDGLVEAYAEYEALVASLKGLYEEIESEIVWTNPGHYVAVEWDRFVAAMADADLKLDKEEATTAEVTAANAAITTAKVHLQERTPAFLTYLAKVDEAEAAIDDAKYTAESRNAFIIALADCNLDLVEGERDYRYTAETLKIEAAMKQLKLVGQVDPDPDPVTPNKYTMDLATTKIIASGSAAEFQPVIGSIKREGTEEDYFKYFVVKASYQSAANSATKVPLQYVKVTNGQFSFFIPTNIPIQDIELKVFGATVDPVTGAWTEVREITEIDAEDRTIQVRYNVTPSTLEFPYTGTQSPVAITGKVTDSKGNPVEAATVTLNAPAAAPVSQITTKTGEFGFVVLEWMEVGNILLTVKENAAVVDEPYVHVKGKVTPKAGGLSVTPKSAVHSLVSIPFKVEGVGFPTAGDIGIKLYKGTTLVAVQNLKVTRGADLTTFEASFDWKPASAGTYTVKASCGNHGAEATINVANPLSYNFINSELLTELPVDAAHTVKIGNPDGVYLLTYDGKNISSGYVYDVYVDGVLKVEKEAEDTIKVPTTKLGTKSFRVIAYTSEVKEGKTVYTKVYEQTFVGQITGWDVTMEPASLTVNKAENISFVIKDKDGVPVNNATILIDGKVYSSPSTYNAQDGTYVLKDVKFSTVGVRNVVIKQGADTRATLKLDVVGEKVYNVTADVDALLQGKAQDVKLTVTRDGKAVIPQRVRVIEKKLDPKELSFTPAADGVTKIEVKAAKAGELIVRVENYDGTLCGEVVINVVAPKLVLLDEKTVNVTDNFKTDVHFKVVDPRDDSVIKSNLYLEGAYLTDLVIYNEHGGTIVNSKGVFTILGAAEHKLTILAKDGLYDDAADEEEDVLVGLRVGAADGALVDGEFLVKEATIESDPGMIIVGAQNNLTLTYKDANGNPIVGKAMKAGEASLGKTDDKGQVIYPVGMPTGSVKVTGATDVKDVVVEHTIKIGYDAEAPKVTYEVKGDKATIVVSDNVRLVRVNIDGKDVDFWPGAKYEFVKTLKPGVNKVHIKAQDSSDNVFDEVVEIEYLSDAIVLKGDQVHREGDFLYVQARQFEELGAKFAWNQATKTAKFVVGETTVEVTIGSTTAKINGETVTMKVAPFIKNDRTYVPVRFVSENLNWNVHWAAGDVVTITLP